jgi:ligand-binding sensor domain-containing protein/two-component sensor histidine kinase
MLTSFRLHAKIWMLLSCFSSTIISLAQSEFYTNVKTFGESENFFPDAGVQHLAQDRNGFIWISTNNGLYRFNGTSFTQFVHAANDSNSLPANNVNFCVQDKDGDYWVGVAGKGLYGYDDSTSHFYKWRSRTPGTLDLGNFPTLATAYADKTGNLWIAAATVGLVRLDKKAGSIKVYELCDTYNSIDLYRTCKWISHITEDKDGWLWLSTNDGLIHFNPKSGEHTPFRVAREITKLRIDGEGKYWVATWGQGLINIDPLTSNSQAYTWTKTTPGLTNIVIDIEEKDRDHLWVSSMDAGLFIFNKRTHEFVAVRSPQGEPMLASTQRLLKDKNGNLWVQATHKLGRIYNNDPFVYGNLANPALGRKKQVECFLQLPKDSILFVGTSYTQEGLINFNLRTNRYKVIDLNPTAEYESVDDIFTADNQKIWISSNTGIYYMDRRSLLPVYFAPPAKRYASYFRSSFVKTFSDAQNRLWFVSKFTGLFCYDSVHHSFLHYCSDSTGIHHIPFDQLEFAMADHKGNVWIGGHAYLQGQSALFCITKGGELVDYQNKIPVDHCFQIAEMADGRIAFVLGNSGYYEITNPLTEREKITAFTSDDGLSSNRLLGFRQDPDRNIWITSYNGLSCKTARGFINFNTNDGLVASVFQAKPYINSEGAVYIPFEDGFQYFNARALSSFHPPIGPVFIESLAINQKPYGANPAFIKELDLKYFQNNISIAFSAFDLNQGDKLQYAYKLEGSGNEWNLLGKARILFLSRLSAGTYKLRIRAGDLYGHWSEKEYVLPIRITPPFWNRWWFYAACSILLIVAAYSIYRFRLNRVLSEQRLRNKIARDLHDDIGSTLSGIKLFSGIARKKLEEERSSALDIVERIGERSESMIDAMSDIVWSINPRNDSVDTMLVRMKQYAAEMLDAKNINYRFDTGNHLSRLKLGLDTRKDLFLFFKESVNNISRHANATTVDIKLESAAQRLLLIVKDNGVGFVMGHQQSQGNGLQNLYDRAHKMSGNLEILSKPGNGTTIILSIPLTP